MRSVLISLEMHLKLVLVLVDDIIRSMSEPNGEVTSFCVRNKTAGGQEKRNL